MSLNKTFLISLLAILLTGLDAALAIDTEEPDEIEMHSHGDFTTKLQETTQSDARIAQDEYLIRQLSSIGRNPTLGGSSIVAALYTTLPLKDNRPIKVREIAQTLVKSNEILQKATELTPETIALKNSIQISNEAYANGLLLVASHIHDSDSPSGQAIIKLLWLGEENARALTQTEQINRSAELMKGVTKALKSKGGAVEPLLDFAINETWPDLSRAKREKIVSNLLDYSP